MNGYNPWTAAGGKGFGAVGNISRIRNASSVMAYADMYRSADTTWGGPTVHLRGHMMGGDWGANPAYSSGEFWRHGNGCNVAFGDGHVAFVQAAAIPVASDTEVFWNALKQ